MPKGLSSIYKNNSKGNNTQTKTIIVWAGVIIVVVLVVVGIVSGNKGIIYLTQIIATLGLIASAIMLDKQNRSKQ